MIIKKVQKLSFWNKLAAIGSIASIAGLILVFLPTDNENTTNQVPQVAGDKSSQQTSGDNSIQVGIVDGNVIIGSPDQQALVEAEPVNIEGNWNQQKALDLVLPELTEQQWHSVEGFCFGSSCNPEHTFLGEYNLLYNIDKEAIILVTSSINTDSSCYACVPSLSFFEFERRPRGWKWTNSDIAVLRWGAWGKVDPSDVNVLTIGENLYGVVLDGTDFHQGILSGNTKIFARIGDSFKELLSLETMKNDASRYTDGPKNDWNSEIKIEPTTTGLYNL